MYIQSVLCCKWYIKEQLYYNFINIWIIKLLLHILLSIQTHCHDMVYWMVAVHLLVCFWWLSLLIGPRLFLFSGLNAISWPTHMHFTRWLIHTNSCDLTCTILYDFCEGWVKGWSFIQICHLVKYVNNFIQSTFLHVWGHLNSCELAT